MRTMLWQLAHGMAKRGSPAATYIDSLKEDVGQEVGDLKSAMVGQGTWRRKVEATNVQPQWPK